MVKIHLIESAKIERVDNTNILRISSNRLIDETEFLELISTNLNHYWRLYEEISQFSTNGNSNHLTLATKDRPIRLGVGSLQVEGDWVVLIKRDDRAPRMPGAYDIAAGVFDSVWSNPLEALFGESAEILRSEGEKVFYLRHKSIIPFERRVMEEYKKSSQIIIGKQDLVPIDVEFIDITNPFILEYNHTFYGCPGTITFEPTNGSLEYITLLDVPQKNYLYFDGELLKEKIPLNREIHKINTADGKVEIWQSGKRVASTDIDYLLKSKPTFTSKATVALCELSKTKKTDILSRLCKYAEKHTK